MKRILFLWDSAAFGGHDVSALVALEHLAGLPDFHVGVLHAARNARLTEALADLSCRTGKLDIIHINAPRSISESLDGIVAGPRTRAFRDAIRRWRPDGAIDVQGFITLGLCPLGACRALRLPVVSFLPMTHRIRDLHPSPMAWVQDGLCHFWYSVPSAFIVTSGRMKDKLVRREGVPSGRVAVAEYGPAWPVPPSRQRAAARGSLGIGDEKFVAMVGRVEFRQKCQDFLIRAVARHHSTLKDTVFAIVGDGPDLEAAKRLARNLGLGNRIRFLPWLNDVGDLYAALDVLLIPSRYEGVPLVMLEAMARGIPVLASSVDGMADFLPAECLFAPGDEDDMVEKIRAVPDSPAPSVVDQLVRLVEHRLNARQFADDFATAVRRQLGESSS